MKEKQKVTQWEAVEAEVLAAIDATSGWLTRQEAEAVVAFVGPLIAARALREIAGAIKAANGPAHTYASENVDLYRGFDNGIKWAIKSLLRRAAALEGRAHV